MSFVQTKMRKKRRMQIRGARSKSPQKRRLQIKTERTEKKKSVKLSLFASPTLPLEKKWQSIA